MIRPLPGGLESPEPHTGRIAPHDTGAEKSVLGALLIDQDAIASIRDTLEPDDFYVERHAQIYRAATALSDRGEPIDTVTLRSELDRHGLLERAGGVAYIAELSVFTPTPVSVRHYADIVADHSLRRRLIRAGADVSALGFDVALGAEAALDTAEQAVFRLSETRHGTEASHLAPIVKELWQMLETRSKEKRLLSGVPTGFRQLDQLTLGLQPGELIVLAARPSVGKTAFALNIARHAAVIEGDPVAIFSLEMGRSALAQRLICSEANVDSYKLRTSQLDAAAYQRIAKAMDQLITADMWIDDTPALSIASLRARARRAKAQRGIKLIVIDYLQLMRGGRQESRVQEVSDISSGLKSIAKELNLPVVALSQLSRESERRENRRPQLSDLRDSGCLAGDTAVLISDEGHTRPIATLVGESGFRTLALNESTWRLEPRRVSRVFSTGHKPLFRMTTALGKQIRATANHRFRTIDAWRRLDELRIGDHLALPRQLPAGSGDSPMASAELALLGHLIGDGCTLPRHAIQYTTADIELARLVAELAHTVFGSRIAARIVAERTWYQVYLASSRRLTHGTRNPISAWLDGLGVFGLRSHEKRVPDEVFKQPSAGIALFLKHLWATDGCIHLSDGADPAIRIYYASSSSKLAADVQSLLLRIGITARLKAVSQGHRGRTQHHVVLSGRSDVRLFLDAVGALRPSSVALQAAMIAHTEALQGNTNRDVIPSAVWRDLALPALAAGGMSHRELHAAMGTKFNGSALYDRNLGRERADRVGSVVGSTELSRLATSDVYWDRVTSIVPDGEEDVYDMTVEELHNFVANDIIVHNSIEQDADVVIFLFRPGMHKEDIDRSKTELIVAKNRNGPTRDIELVFLAEQTAFKEPFQPREPG